MNLYFVTETVFNSVKKKKKHQNDQPNIDFFLYVTANKQFFFDICPP